MLKSQKLKIVLAGGGSSNGHIMPLVAVAEVLKPVADLLWIGDFHSRAEETAHLANIPFQAIPTGKIHRYFTLKNLTTPFRYWAGIRAAKKILLEFAPDVVFGKGGSVSLPVVQAAARLGIPVVIHESDAVMGLGNRRAATLAKRVCVSFPAETYPGYSKEKLVYTGVPVRQVFFQTKSRKRDRAQILVTGGGQGSDAINQVIWSALPELLKVANVVHLTGERSYSGAKGYQQSGYQPIAYARDEMAQLMVDADVVISRASATTLAEIAATGRPTVLIPLPTAANDHQRANARVWSSVGAGIYLEERDLTPEKLFDVVGKLINDSGKRAEMGQAAKSLAQPKAANEIASLLISIAGKERV